MITDEIQPGPRFVRAPAYARLHDELSAVVATTNRLRELLDVARAVTGESGLEALLSRVARIIAEDHGWAVVLHLYRPAHDDFVARTSEGVAPERWAHLAGTSTEWTAWTDRLDERHARRGAYVVSDDEVLIPLRHADGHLLGVVALDAPGSAGRPSDAALDALVALVSHAALAVEQAEASIAAAGRAAALDRLLQVSATVAAMRDVDQMLQLVAQAITDALGFGRVVVEVAGADGLLRPRAGTGGAAPFLAPLPADATAALLDPGFAVEGCFVLAREEADDRLPEARRSLLASRANGRGWRAWDDHVVLVALHGAEDDLVGVIWVDDPADRLVPGDDRLQALHAFATMASAALATADRYERLATVCDGDPLTHLGNRRAFLRELGREVARAGRTGTASVLVLVDVEDCPALSDAADPAEMALAHRGLLEVATAFEAELRRHDRAFRIDGTLFGVLLTGGQRPPDTGAVTLRMAARMRSVGKREGVRVSFGTAALGPQAEAPDAVFRRAADSLLSARRVLARS